jgi:hypothetical protein
MDFSTTKITAGNAIIKLEDEWKRIDRKKTFNNRYFCSWPWVKSWITPLPIESLLWVSRAFNVDGELEGIILFGETTRTRFKCITVKQLHAFRKGVDYFDQIWVEYVEPHTCDELSHIVFDKWMSSIKSDTNTDEIIFNVMCLDTSSFLKDSTLDFVLSNEEGGGYAMLQDMYMFENKHIRRQVRQTEKALCSSGLALSENYGEGRSKALFDASFWHKNKWKKTTTPSGFENPSFISSHVLMTTLHDKTLHTRVFTATSAGEPVGVMYFMQQHNWVGFYLFCGAPVESNHVHLGTWMHTKIMAQLKTEGVVEYDFMAGDEAYKKRLSTHSRRYGQVVFFGENKLGWLERKLKQLNYNITKYKGTFR